MSATIHAKDESTLAVWRIGLVAYRDARRRELSHFDCCNAGKAAILAAYPAMSREEASAAIVNAVAWASVHHREWLHRGVRRREWIWPADHRGVGLHRNPGYEDV
jgi:hypothetical protein